MQSQPLVTVICLCYNHSQFVIQSLQSVINQTYNNIELIIADDYSTDHSVQIINNWLVDYPESIFIANKVNLGNTKTFNLAAKFAKGKYIIDLAADDILLPNCIGLQVNCFEKSIFKNLAIVYGNVQNINEKGRVISNYFEVDNTDKVTENINTGNVYLSIIGTGKSICSVSAMIKREIFDTVGGYDETLAYEDLDFWIRVARNYEIDFIDAFLVQKRVLDQSMSSNFTLRNSQLNQSTYTILKNTIFLNRTLNEDLAVQKRVHFEIINSYKNKDFILIIKNLGLKIWLIWRRFF